MRKKRIFTLAFIIIIFLILLFLFQNNFFSDKYELNLNGKKIDIKIPKFSYVTNSKNSNLKFQTFSSIEQVNTVRDEYLSDFRKLYCNIDDITYYFDNKSGLSVYNYQVFNNGVINSFSFDYYYGNYCNDKEMEKIQKELDSLDFEIEVISIPNCKTKELEKVYFNDDYDIYTNCLSGINLIKDNIEKNLIDELSINSEIINKMKRKLEIGSMYAEGSKNIYDDGSILYSNYHYRLLECPNSRKTYIIGNTYLEHYESICDL